YIDKSYSLLYGGCYTNSNIKVALNIELEEEALIYSYKTKTQGSTKVDAANEHWTANLGCGVSTSLYRNSTKSNNTGNQ
ncbi:9054_t:CDS:1, partial [Gigaspora rosea]